MRFTRALAVLVLVVGFGAAGIAGAAADSAPHGGAFGMVVSVNGSTAAGACGVAGAAGTYTIASGHHEQTVVDVTETTTFSGRGLSSPSFANVCVNEAAGARGTVSDGVLTATSVRIWSRPSKSPVSAFGLVTSVNGSTTAGACGVAGQPGTFTITSRDSSQTVVNVTATTKFRERDVSSPSFAGVCVNTTVRAAGTTSNGELNADGVQIWSSPADD